MNKLWLYLSLLIACASLCEAYGQSVADTNQLSAYLGDTSASVITPPVTPSASVFKPTLGLGAGMFTYYGDISAGKHANNALVSRVGWDLRLSQPLNDWLNLDFYFLWGKLGANERTLERNLNFESEIQMGGFNLVYNFHQLLPEDRTIEPYFLVGFESFEFLSKTDLYDAYGNYYYYWSDGSMRNLPEDDPNAANAIILQRDYTYESDIRESNMDGFGKYPERSWSVPVGAGAHLHVSDKVKFRIGTTMHFALTDLVDGVTDQSLGSRKGDAKNDRFLYTSFSLLYNLRIDNGNEGLEDEYNDVDFAMMDMADSDQDGVRDFDDECPFTPLGVEVDEHGCPLDVDNDAVEDFEDKEVPTQDSLFTDEEGVGLTDSLLELRYLMFMDSTGMFATIEETEHQTDAALIAKFANKNRHRKYIVKVAETNDEIGIPIDLAEQLLSDPGLKTIDYDDGTTVFISGEFDSLPPAIREYYRQKKKYQGSTVITPNGDSDGYKTVDVSKYPPPNDVTAVETGTIFRVQLGAFRQKLSKNIFSDIPDIISIPGDDGLTRYYTRSYGSYRRAAERKLDVMTGGFSDAFIVPFKDGGRITLKEAGATIVKGQEHAIEQQEKKENSSVNKNLIKFRVQVAAFKEGIPTDILEKLMTLGKVEAKTSDDGWTKYVIGSFSNYNSAEASRKEISEKGFDAFVVGEFQGKLISSKEAQQMLNN